MRALGLAYAMRTLGYAVAMAFAAFGVLLFLGLVSLRLPVGGPAQQVAGVCLALYGMLRFCQTWLRGRPVSRVDDGNEE